MNAIQQVELQPAFILYAKPFRETSLLLEVFCRDYGRVSLVARGARRIVENKAKRYRPRFYSVLQPFVSLLLSWRGRGELFNLTHAEPNAMRLQIAGSLLPASWYMNELLVRTLKHWDAHVGLFTDYQTALSTLKSNLPLSLRQFEKSLLMSLGIMPSLDYEAISSIPVQEDQYYLFSPVQGVCSTPCKLNHVGCFRGDVLLAIQHNHWEESKYWPHMKRLFRLVLDHILAEKVIRSRDLL